MNRTVNHLEAAGYVRRTPDADDGTQRVVVTVTEPGLALVTETRPPARRLAAQTAAHASPPEQAAPSSPTPPSSSESWPIRGVRCFRSLAGRELPHLGRGGRSSPTSAPGCRRTAQDWIVLTQLNHNNAAAGSVFVMALQVRPRSCCCSRSPAGRADRLDRRKLLIGDAGRGWGALGLGLGILTVSGGRGALARLRVRAAARLRRRVRTRPPRQTFVSELRPPAPTCRTRVALNSASFHHGPV